MLRLRYANFDALPQRLRLKLLYLQALANSLKTTIFSVDKANLLQYSLYPLKERGVDFITSEAFADHDPLLPREL